VDGVVDAAAPSFAAPALTAELADEAAERVVGLMVGMEPLLVGWGIRDGG
jgi:hypothetical protein